MSVASYSAPCIISDVDFSSKGPPPLVLASTFIAFFAVKNLVNCEYSSSFFGTDAKYSNEIDFFHFLFETQSFSLC